MFWRRSVADQVDEELDFHLEMVTRDLIAKGRSEPDARTEALRRFGDLAEVGARCRKLGLEHERFQNKTSGAHYDVPALLREEALRLGAVAISRHNDRALVRAVIRQAKAQGRGEHP